MTEYIDLDTPLELYVDRGGFYRQQITTLRELLDTNRIQYKSADVRPVVRGRWIKCVGENGVTSACRCSLCGFEDNRFSVFNFCPNCGADMREEGE